MMIQLRTMSVLGIATILAALTGCMTSGADQAAADHDAPKSPGLVVGEHAPDVDLTDSTGKRVSLSSLYAKRPVVVTFYRGGWCPFCIKALSDWRLRVPDLSAAGADFVAITMEKPEYVDETVDKHALNYTVLLDDAGRAAELFKVKFRLDEATQTKYKGYGIDLAAHNSSGQWTLPAPGTFLIDTDGVIRYAFADWDYKKRADPDEVIAAARALLD